MTRTRLEEWERRLKQVLDRVDDFLEDKHGDLYPRHPARPARGTTGSKQHDGLFQISAKYSLGIGSPLGEGYVLEVRLASLASVSGELKNQIQEEVAGLLRQELPKVFHDRNLQVSRDGAAYKIHGDLSLD